MHRRSWLTMDTIGENTVKSTSKEASFHGAIINARILTVRLKRFSKGHTKGRSLRLYTRGHMTILNLSLVAGTQAVLLCLHRKIYWIRILLLMAEMVNYSSVCTIFFQKHSFCSFCYTEKGSSLYNMSPPMEQIGNDDGGDLGMSNKNNDDVDENDPFSKRRY